MLVAVNKLGGQMLSPKFEYDDVAIKSDTWHWMAGQRFEINLRSCDITGHENYLSGLEIAGIIIDLLENKRFKDKGIERI